MGTLVELLLLESEAFSMDSAIELISSLDAEDRDIEADVAL